MQTNAKYLVITLILLCSISNVYAWASEVAMVGNESLDYGIDPIFNESTVNDPYRYDADKQLINPSFRSNDAFTMCTSYFVYKYEWDGSSYVKNTDCYISIDECIAMQYKVDANGEGYYGIPDNWESQVSDGYLIKRYFQSMLNAGNIDCAEWDNIDESVKPDVFEIESDIDVNRFDLDESVTGYVILDDDAEKNLKRIQDHGFDINSIAGEGGSGALSNMVGWGDMDETSKEHKNLFDIFFFTLIPIIFIMLIANVVGKIL